MMQTADSLLPLRQFVIAMTHLVDQAPGEAAILAQGRGLLAQLLRTDDWLPQAFAQPSPASYRQYLLHCDPLERFSVVSFVWGAGHITPIHDHTVWGLVGVLRGAERCIEHEPVQDQIRPTGREHVMHPGDIEAVSPTVGDWHVVCHAGEADVAVSIHVYGANIGAVRRHLFDPVSATIRDFVSGYSAATLPNLWDRSEVVREALAAR
jgi:predicted metal-dependent enzyme (double-stranded beta helix superfamily)